MENSTGFEKQLKYLIEKQMFAVKPCVPLNTDSQRLNPLQLGLYSKLQSNPGAILQPAGGDSIASLAELPPEAHFLRFGTKTKICL